MHRTQNTAPDTCYLTAMGQLLEGAKNTNESRYFQAAALASRLRTGLTTPDLFTHALASAFSVTACLFLEHAPLYDETTNMLRTVFRFAPTAELRSSALSLWGILDQTPYYTRNKGLLAACAATLTCQTRKNEEARYSWPTDLTARLFTQHYSARALKNAQTLSLLHKAALNV